MFEASGPAGSDGSQTGQTVWDTASSALSSYFTSDRAAAIAATASECLTSVSWLYTTSMETAEFTPVAAFLAGTATLGLAGCIAFGSGAVFGSSDQIAAIPNLVGYATPLGLGFSAAGALIGGETYSDMGRDAGAAMNDLLGLGSDSLQFLGSNSNWLTLPSLLGNDYSFTSDLRALSDDLQKLSPANNSDEDEDDDTEAADAETSGAASNAALTEPTGDDEPDDPNDAGDTAPAASSSGGAGDDGYDGDDDPDDGWDW